MTVNYTTLLGLGQPVTGTESGTWGDDVNNAVTSYLDIAIAGTLTLTGDGAVTLANTFGSSTATNIGSTTAQYYMLKIVGPLSATKVITAPSVSKTYIVNNTDSTYGVTIKASGQTGVTVAANTKALVMFDGTDYVFVLGSAGTTIAGNLTFTGTGNRIIGDFSNATAATRVLFQTNAPNERTIIGAIPSGTGNTAGITCFNNSNPTNSSAVRLQVTDTEVRLVSGTEGSGTHLPLTVTTFGIERMRVTVAGDVGIGTASPVAKLQIEGGTIGKGGAIGHHVEAYGAVGNGSTDDTAAIQAAVNAAKAGTNGSNVVIFGAKSYRITAQITVGLSNTQSVELRGMVPSVNAANTAQAQGTRIVYDSTSTSGRAFLVFGNESVGTSRAAFIARDLWIGVASVGQGVGQTGLQIGSDSYFWEPYSKIILDNVQCWKFSEAGFKVVNTHRVAMSKCIAYTPGDGGSAIGLYVLATGGYFCGGVIAETCEFTSGAGSGTTERPVKIEATGAGSVSAGNMFNDTVLYYGEVGMDIYAHNAGTISDIYINNTQIDGYQPGGDADPNLDYGLYLRTDTNASSVLTDVTVSNSYFVGYNLHGIYVKGTTQSPIKNCSFRGNQIKWNDSHGVKCENAWGFNFVGNTFNNNGSAAGSGGDANLYLTLCQYFSVSSNVGYNLNNSQTNAYGVYLPATYSDQFSIVNNSMVAAFANVSDNSTGSNKTVSGNYN